MKDHQKKSELKTPKIDPVLDVFSEATEKSFKYKMKQKLLSVNQKVISKKVDLETFCVQNSHVCESVCVWEKIFEETFFSIDREEFCGIGLKIVAPSGGNLESFRAISNTRIDNQFVLPLHIKASIVDWEMSVWKSVHILYWRHSLKIDVTFF